LFFLPSPSHTSHLLSISSSALSFPFSLTSLFPLSLLYSLSHFNSFLPCIVFLTFHSQSSLTFPPLYPVTHILGYTTLTSSSS
jgi:uncharacterized membrane protein YesL